MSEVAYLIAPGGRQRLGEMTAISKRAVALSAAAHALALALYGYTIERVTIERFGVLSATDVADAAAVAPAHKGIALWCSVDSPALFCASGTAGRWHGPTRAAIAKLAEGDLAAIDRWHQTATHWVMAHQAAITRVGEALLRHGTLSGDALLEVAHAAPPPTPSARMSEAEETAWLADLQKRQKAATYALGGKGAAR